ncbi:MAG: hypothetical protein KKA84_05225 [Bacteroidetes bacterium]|nr:hypothetical protein [Bacteroidota bacterium]
MPLSLGDIGFIILSICLVLIIGGYFSWWSAQKKLGVSKKEIKIFRYILEDLLPNKSVYLGGIIVMFGAAAKILPEIVDFDEGIGLSIIFYGLLTEGIVLFLMFIVNEPQTKNGNGVTQVIDIEPVVNGLNDLNKNFNRILPNISSLSSENTREISHNFDSLALELQELIREIKTADQKNNEVLKENVKELIAVIKDSKIANNDDIRENTRIILNLKNKIDSFLESLKKALS